MQKKTQLKHDEAVQVEVGMIGNHIILNIPLKDYLALEKEVEDSSVLWTEIELDGGAKVRIRTSSVQYLRLKPSGVRQLKKREGVPLKVIAETLGESYDYFRQKIKRQGIVLEKGSERRILLSDENIKLLELTATQVKKILDYSKGK